MITTFTTAIIPPPLNVQIIVKRSDTIFGNGAKVVTLESKHSDDIEWHTSDLLNDRFDLWQFVNAEDAYEYEAKQTARCG